MNPRLRLRAKSKQECEDPKGTAGWLYIIQLWDTDIFKIGISQDPWKRCKQLQRKSPVQLLLIGSWRGHDYKAMERKLHYTFRRQRIRGEWFRLKPVDLIQIFEYFPSITQGLSLEPVMLSASMDERIN